MRSEVKIMARKKAALISGLAVGALCAVIGLFVLKNKANRA